MKKRIGIDIDDTLTNLFDVFLSYGFKYAYEKSITINSLFINGYEAIDTFRFTKEQDKDFQEKYLGKILNNVKARPLASEVINILKKEYEIFIITSRDDDLLVDCKDKTEKWLKNNNISYDELVYNCKEKAQFCKENNIDYLIDDNFNHCEDAAKVGTISFIYDNQFNKDYYNNNIIRVYSWGQILYEIKNRNNAVDTNQKKW